MPQAAMQPEQQMAPEGEQRPEGSQFPELPAEMSEDAQGMVVMSRRALLDEKAGAVLMQILENANDFAHGAAVVAYKLIDKANDDAPEVADEEIYGDMGVGEFILDAIFALAQQEGIPGSDDPQAFAEARGLLEEMAGGVTGLTNEQGDPDAQDPGAVSQDADVDPATAGAPILQRG